MSTWAMTLRIAPKCAARSGATEKDGDCSTIYAAVAMLGLLVGAAFAVVVLGTLVIRLRASEARARGRGQALAEAEGVARLGSYRLDVESWRATWSDGMYRLLGLEPGDGEPAYERFLEHVHPEDRQRFDESIRSAIRQGDPFAADCRILVPGAGERIMH